MILWSIKLIGTVRKAIAGRRYPSQLAWAAAFGLLLGLVPHGNLVAVVILLVVLALRLNHAMAALTAIAVTLVATKLDPLFHAVGQRVLSEPRVADQMTIAWDWPLMAWTNLNNTVVMGSLVVGVVSLLPSFALTYPVFKRWSKGLLAAEEAAADAAREHQRRLSDNKAKRQRERTQIAVPEATETELAIDSAHDSGPARPHGRSTKPSTPSASPTPSGPTASSGRIYDFRRVDPSHDAVSDAVGASPAPGSQVSDAVAAPQPTRIEVAPRRALAVANATLKASQQGVVTTIDAAEVSTQDDQQKIDEALRYLLRQLRDSQEKDAA